MSKKVSAKMSLGIDKNVHSVWTKMSVPMDKNVPHNNTYNNTINNKVSNDTLETKVS